MNSLDSIYRDRFNSAPTSTPQPNDNDDDWMKKMRKYRECTEKCFQKHKWSTKSDMYQCLRRCYRKDPKELSSEEIQAQLAIASKK